MATWLDSVETTKVEDNVTANKPGESRDMMDRWNIHAENTNIQIGNVFF